MQVNRAEGWSPSHLESLHLELSSYCNASCPQCKRNVDGGPTNPFLPLTQLRLSDVEKIFYNIKLPKLRSVQFCGVYGDSITAVDLKEIIEFFSHVFPQASLLLETNGGLHDTAWWEHLGGMQIECVFALDGLADTHSLYRIGTDFDTVLTNARAFMRGGGTAHWQFIVFKHNEHQLTEARKLSDQYGFESFRLIKTSRFVSNGSVRDSAPVRNRQGEVLYHLAPPEHVQLTPDVESVARKQYEANKGALSSITVDCKYLKRKKLYISSEGIVFPCCWTASVYRPDDPEFTSGIWTLINALPGGLSELSATTHGLQKVMQHAFFQATLPDHWGKNPAGPRVCVKNCGCSTAQQALEP